MSADGNPTGIAPYPGQERFSDGKFETVESWDAALALQATRALDLPTREQQVARIREAVEDGLLPPDAVEALVAAGWHELADEVPGHPLAESDIVEVERADGVEMRVGPGSLALMEGAAHSGAMVAVFPPTKTAEKLAQPGGEPAEDLHVTLAFLGEADRLKDVDRLKTVVAGVAAAAPALKGEVAGTGVFRNGESPVTWAAIDAPGLERVRERVVEALRSAGYTVADNHGFTPHMTLAYDARGVELPQEPLEFGELVLAVAGKRYTFALAGTSDG